MHNARKLVTQGVDWRYFPEGSSHKHAFFFRVSICSFLLSTTSLDKPDDLKPDDLTYNQQPHDKRDDLTYNQQPHDVTK